MCNIVFSYPGTDDVKMVGESLAEAMELVIEGGFAGYEILHATGQGKEGEEIDEQQGGVGEDAVAEEQGHAGDLRFDEVVAQQQGDGGENGEDEVVGHHAAPVDGDTLVETLGEEEVGLPEHGNEEDAENLAQQDANDAEEGSQTEGDGDVQRQLGPGCPDIREETVGRDVHLDNTA